MSRTVLAADAAVSPAFLTEPEVSIYTGIAPATLRKYRTNHRGPAFHRIGSSIRYRKDDVDAWLERHRVPTLDAA